MVARLAAAAALCAGATSASAQTSCTAANQFVYDFATQPATQLAYASTYNWTATNSLGATQAFSVGFFTNGVTNSVVGGFQMPRISTMVNDGNPATANNLAIGGTFGARTTSITSAVNVIRVTFTFPVPVREIAFQVNDIDYAANQYRDWFDIRGANGASTYTAAMTTPFGNNNTGGTATATNSTVQLGASTTPLTVGVNEALGNAVSGNAANNGTVTAVFAQPVRTVTLSYGNSNQSPGGTTTGQQAYGIQSLRFCPMPSVAVVKTSTPVATSGIDRFNLPGAFVDYSIQVTNSGGSTVDGSSTIVTDLLPAGVTFFNGDIDPGTAGVQPFVFTPGTSGLTLPAAGAAYSSNAGVTYAYTPAAGPDLAVNGVRYQPVGTMAANSSFTVRFRVAVK